MRPSGAAGFGCRRPFQQQPSGAGGDGRQPSARARFSGYPKDYLAPRAIEKKRMRQRFVFLSLKSIKCGMLSENTAQLKSHPYSFFFIHNRMILIIQATKKTIITVIFNIIRQLDSYAWLCCTLLFPCEKYRCGLLRFACPENLIPGQGIPAMKKSGRTSQTDKKHQ
ncbi:MAG: hypothetical protein PHG06_07525 [Parabacteroides sp.]|nr:hypothetical protein [Parabacteroides sp.]